MTVIATLTEQWFIGKKTIDGLDGNGLLKTFALLMEVVLFFHQKCKCFE